MGSFRTGPVSAILLVGLLAWIAIVLVAPQVDLEDAAFRSGQAPLQIHVLACHVPQADLTFSLPGITHPPAQAPAVVLESGLLETAVEVPSTPPRVLRC